MSFRNNPRGHEEGEGWEVGENGPNWIWFDLVDNFNRRPFQRVQVRDVLNDMVSIVDFFNQGSLGIDTLQSIFFRESVPRLDPLQLCLWWATE